MVNNVKAIGHVEFPCPDVDSLLMTLLNLMDTCAFKNSTVFLFSPCLFCNNFPLTSNHLFKKHIALKYNSISQLMDLSFVYCIRALLSP